MTPKYSQVLSHCSYCQWEAWVLFLFYLRLDSMTQKALKPNKIYLSRTFKVNLSLQWLALSNQASFHYLTISHCLTASLVVFISKGNNSQETFPFKSDKYGKYLIEPGHGGVEFSVLHLGLATGGHCQFCLVSLDLIHLYFWGNTKIYFKGDLTTLNKMWICWIILSLYL